MKSKKARFALLLVGLLVTIFGLDMSINAKVLNVDRATEPQQILQKPSVPLPPWIAYLLSFGMLGMVVCSRRVGSYASRAIHRRHLPDHGGRRSKEDRRQFSYTYFMPERRSGVERRVTIDRRLS